ncbi:MAG: hypothetical protein AAGE52_01350 [Myxococcota bacterium]
MTKFKRALEILGMIFEWARRLFEAIKDEDEQRVDELLDDELALTVERRLAEDDARRKWGDS